MRVGNPSTEDSMVPLPYSLLRELLMIGDCETGDFHQYPISIGHHSKAFSSNYYLPAHTAKQATRYLQCTPFWTLPPPTASSCCSQYLQRPPATLLRSDTIQDAFSDLRCSFYYCNPCVHINFVHILQWLQDGNADKSTRKMIAEAGGQIS